jgi:CRP-like cAMP-binding protein
VKCSGCAVNRDCFLGGMPVQAMRALTRYQVATERTKDTTLFKEGQPPRGVVVLCQGHVNLFLGSNGQEQLLRAMRPGEVTGLSAAISGNHHDETAETATNSRMVFIERDHLLRCLRTHADAWIRVVEFLSEDVRAAEDRVRRLVLGRVLHSTLMPE